MKATILERTVQLETDLRELQGEITDSKRAEETLRQSEERARLMVEGVKDYAILMLDLKGRVTTWNAGTEHIKGYSAQEIIGQPFSIFYTGEDAASGKPERDLEVAAKEGRTEEEGGGVRKGGARFWANVIITAINDKDGRPIGYSKVTRDLTDRKRAEETLRQSEEQFRLISENVADLIAVLDLQGTRVYSSPS